MGGEAASLIAYFSAVHGVQRIPPRSAAATAALCGRQLFSAWQLLLSWKGEGRLCQAPLLSLGHQLSLYVLLCLQIQPRQLVRRLGLGPGASGAAAGRNSSTGFPCIHALGPESTAGVPFQPFAGWTHTAGRGQQLCCLLLIRRHCPSLLSCRMLEQTSPHNEEVLGVNFTDVYAASELAK